jgi:hypothetical protein
VHIVGECLDAVRETLWIRDDRSGGIATDLPAVVDYHVPVPGVAHAARHERVRGFSNQFLADVAAKWFQLFHPIGGVSARRAGGDVRYAAVAPSVRRRRAPSGRSV